MKELRFLLEHVLKVDILGHAQTLTRFTLDEIFQELEDFKRKLKTTDLKGRDLYSTLFSAPIFGFSLPREYGGKGMAESLSLLFFSEIAEVNAYVGFELMQSQACFHLLTRYNQDGRFTEILKKMVTGEVQGVLELLDPTGEISCTETLKVQETKERFTLSGSKMLFFIPSKAEKFFLVTAPVPQGRMLFLVRESGVHINKLQSEHFYSPVDVIFDSFCEIQPVGLLDGDYFAQSSMRKFIILLAMSQLDQSYRRALHHARKAPLQGKEGKTLLDHSKVAESLILMKCYRDGLRTMIFQSSFYQDCARHGAEGTKDYFNKLSYLFGVIFKYYTPRKAELIRGIASPILGGAYFAQEDQNLLQYTDLLAGNPIDLISRLVLKDLPKENGELINLLLREFGNLEAHAAQTEEMTECLNIWRDYVGGLFLLNNELAESKGKKQDQLLINAERIVELLGDVILAYLLIKEAMEAEKTLQELGINFFNLQAEVLRNPECHELYNKIVGAHYFCQSILSLQDAKIPLIQKEYLTALNGILQETH